MRNLLGRLLERSATEIDRIAAFWDADLGGRDRYADVASVYRAMTDIWVARDTYEQLSASQLKLFRALRALDGEGRTPPALADAIDGDIESTRTALRQLYAAGIIAMDDDPARDERGDGERVLYMPRELNLVFERIEAERGDRPHHDAELDELLGRVSLAELEEAASRWGARVTPGIHARPELIELLLGQLQKPERVERFIGNLSGPAREIWRRLQDAGGQRELVQLLPPDQFQSRIRRQVLRELAEPLLAWHSYQGLDDDLIRLLFIPDAILNPSQPEPQPLPELEAYDAADVVEQEWIFPQAAAWDLLTIVREVIISGPRWNGLVESDPAISRRFRSRLWRSERESGDLPTGYIAFLVQLGAMMGVLQDEESRAIPGPEAKIWRENAFTTAERRMVRTWTAAETWLEGRSRIELAMYGAAWPAYRAILLRNLGELDADLWYDEERFVDRLIRAEPDLLRQAQVGAVASSQLAMHLNERSNVEDRREQVLRLITETTLTTACVWLNLIERSRHMQTGRPVFRLTPFGSWIAGPRSEPAGQHIGPAPIAVGANFQILLYRPTPRRVWALSAFAELKSLDRVSSYTLTAPALIRALASGVNLSDVIRVLEGQSGEALPQAVSYTLQDWDRGYRRVWLRRGVLLVPEEGEDSQKISEALKETGLDPEILPDGRLVLAYDAQDAGERLYNAASRALRERGFAPLTDPDSFPRRDGQPDDG